MINSVDNLDIGLQKMVLINYHLVILISNIFILFSNVLKAILCIIFI